MKHEPILPGNWTPEQVEAVGDFFWAVYEHLIDVLCVHYPAAVMGTRIDDELPLPTTPDRNHAPLSRLDDIPS